MKKTILLFAIFISISISASSQVFTSGFETWTTSPPIKPTDWWGLKTNYSNADSTAQYTSSVHGGTYAIKLQSRTANHKRLTTQAITIAAATSYTISFWVRGHGSIRTGLYDGGPYGSSYTYNSYINVNSTAWTQQTQTIASDTNSVTAEFILSAKSTFPDLEDLQVDDVSITAAATVPVTIHDIQYTTIPNGDSPYNNQTVITSGMVTGKYSKGYFLQDGTGLWNGIYVLDSINAGTVNLGDVISITGQVYEYFNLTEIKNITAFSIVSSGGILPVPYAVTAPTVKAENVEGVLVKITDATCVDANAGYGMWTVNDGTDTCKIHDLLYHFTPTLNTHYDITGPVYYAYSEYRIEPRSANDVVIHTGINEVEQNSLYIYPNPVSNVLYVNNIGSTEMIKVSNILGQTVQTMKVKGPNARINVNNLPAGIYFISLFDKNGLTELKKFLKN